MSRRYFGFANPHYEQHSADWSTRLERDETGDFRVLFQNRHAATFVDREVARVVVRALKGARS